jgi:hypothetical protein
MSKSKTRLGLIGLCVTAAMAMMAFAASGAQAAAWMVGGSTLNSGSLSVEVVATLEEEATLLSQAAGSSIAISCATLKAEEVVLLGGGVAHGKLVFTKCKTALKGSPAAACNPKEPIVAKGLLLVVKHNGATYVLAEPESGKPFTTLTLGTEEECAIGEEFAVTGQLWIVDCEGDPETELLTHLIQEGEEAAAALGGLFFGVNKATIDGSAIVEVFDGGMEASTASWVVDGTTVTSNLPVDVVATLEEEATPLSKAAGSSVAISCASLKAEEEVLLGTGVAHGKVIFTKCKTALNGSLAAACTPKEPIVAKGLRLVVKHEGKTSVLAEPESGKKFTTLTLGTG